MNLKTKISEGIKNLARRILRKELLQMQDQLINVTEERRTWRKRYEKLTTDRVTLPLSALYGIYKILPDANLFAKGRVDVRDFHNGKYQEYCDTTTIPETRIRIRVKEISPNSITLNIAFWNIDVIIPLQYKTLHSNGNAVITTYVWDLLNSNIGGFLDITSTDAVATFLNAVKDINDD